MAWEIVDIEGLTSLRISPELLSNIRIAATEVYSGTSDVFLTDSDNFADVYTPTDDSWGYIINDTDFKLRYKSYLKHPSYNPNRTEHALQSGVVISRYSRDDNKYSPDVTSNTLNLYGYTICINHETERAQLCWGWRIYQGNTTTISNCWIVSIITSDSAAADFYTYVIGHMPSSDIIGTGGGATHVAKVTGLLSTLSSNLSDILAVAGGGGGGRVSSETAYTGANAGGISGSGSNSADQSTGYGFGQGESYGGGSGLYGGYKAENANGGGAGSGYIGNALLSNKKMVGYNVPTSSAESTKTESVNTYSANAEANKPKAGNGFVKITWLREIPEE